MFIMHLIQKIFRQHVSAANATIATKYNGTNDASCVAFTQQQLKIIIPSVKSIQKT
jgi:hypothetical protein